MHLFFIQHKTRFLGRLDMKKILSVILFVFIGLNASAQIPTNQLEVDVNVFPKEKAALYINSNVLLAGESLQYKISILNNVNTPSNLSKIAYVSLRDQNDSIVFNHKLRLENGSADNSFFLPSNLNTGSYNLIGYTNFSRNDASEPFAQKNIYIINTFIENSENPKPVDTVKVNAIYQDVDDLSSKKVKEPNITIKPDKQTYGYREKVTLNMDLSAKGSYVLSVRRITPAEISQQAPERTQENTRQIFYLPELRGEIISGQILLNGDNTPLSNKGVSLTVPGKDFIFKMSKTDRNGRFFFSIMENYESERSVIQVVEETKENPGNYRIVLDSKDLTLNGAPLGFLKLDPNLKKWLEDRSVQIQIENAYFEKKKDSLLPRKPSVEFYDGLGTLYVLDDYTRFPTVRETFIEIIKLAAIRGSGDNSRFLVYNEYDPKGIGKFNDIPPLVLVDGMLIQDNRELLEYSAMEIKNIRVVNKPYRYGPRLYSGIISIETKKGDFAPVLMSYMEEINLPPTVRKRKYFTPDYLDKSISNRIPDYRVQLLWKPELDLSSSNKSISFYTSDIPGIYKIALEGFDGTGGETVAQTFFKVVSQ